MSHCSPSLGASQQSASSNFSLDPCSLVVQGRRRRQTPCSAQTSMTNYDLFSTSSFDCNFSRNDNQTFNVYMESTLSRYRKGLVLFSQLSNSPRKSFSVNQSVATISDQRVPHMSAFPLANWSVQSPIGAHARSCLICP